MAEVSPLAALAGGLMIGAGAVLLMLANGRVMGVAGIIGCLMRDPLGSDSRWRLAFLVGMVAPALLAGIGGMLRIGALPALPIILAGGFLVGFGTRMGNGCTSGHGICGLARMSPRSLAAVGVFMAACAVTVFLTRHVAFGG